MNDSVADLTLTQDVKRRPNDPSLANAETRANPTRLKEAESSHSNLSKRSEILQGADAAVSGDRNVDYGPPDADFKTTAEFWNTYLNRVLTRKMGSTPIDARTQTVLNTLIDSWDVGAMMILLKLSRISWSPQVEDHWMDSAGYAACAGECIDLHMHPEHRTS